jgi:hypothetical protein
MLVDRYQRCRRATLARLNRAGTNLGLLPATWASRSAVRTAVGSLDANIQRIEGCGGGNSLRVSVQRLSRFRHRHRQRCPLSGSLRRPVGARNDARALQKDWPRQVMLKAATLRSNTGWLEVCPSGCRTWPMI